MLDRLDAAALAPGEQTAFDYALSELAPPKKVFTFSFTPTLELRGHTNPVDFVLPEQYVRPWNMAKPMLAFGTEAWFSHLFYVLGTVDIGTDVMTNMVTAPNGASYPGSKFFGEGAFSTNIWLVPPSDMDALDWITPKRALISVGGEQWYATIGRDRLAWGPGESGNFMVGSHVDYHDSVRMVLFNDSIKYTYNVSAFQYPGEYLTGTTYKPEGDPYNIIQGTNLFIAHRFEWRAWKNKLNFAFTEALMHSVPQGGLPNPMALIPSLIMHNIYRFEEMNSLMTFEADWTPMPLLNIYGQFAMDEFAMPGDDPITATTSNIPNAFGWMLGAQTAFPLFGHIFTGSFEFALTDPYLYLRSGGHGNQDNGTAGINYIVANRATFPVLYYEEFLGYRWGGDDIVLNAHAGYREFGAWSLEANILFMIHGAHDKWTTYQAVYAENDLGNNPQDNRTPTESHPQANHADPNAAVRNAPYYLTAFSILGSWNIGTLPSLAHIPALRTLALYGQIDVVAIFNPWNIRENAPIADLQFTLGVSYQL
jgi:hypothetical protein